MEKGVLRRLKNGRIAPPDISSMATYLDGLLQDALDAEEAPAVRTLRALGLTASAAKTPADRRRMRRCNHMIVGADQRSRTISTSRHRERQFTPLKV